MKRTLPLALCAVFLFGSVLVTRSADAIQPICFKCNKTILLPWFCDSFVSWGYVKCWASAGQCHTEIGMCSTEANVTR